MTDHDENRDISVEDVFDLYRAELSDEQVRRNNLFSRPPYGAMQPYHTSGQPEEEIGDNQQIDLQAGDTTHVEANTQDPVTEATGTPELTVPDFRGVPVIFLPQYVGDGPNGPAVLLPMEPSSPPWSFMPPVYGQFQQGYQWLPQQIPPYPPVFGTEDHLPQLQIERYHANRNIIGFYHRTLWPSQPPGSIYCAVELEGTSMTVHDLASQLTTLLPSKYLAVQNVPFSPLSYLEIRQYVHSVDSGRKSLLEGFMGGNPGSLFFACTVVEPVNLRSVAMGRIERRSRYPLFRDSDEHLFFQIRDLALRPGRTPGVGGWVIASLLLAVLHTLPRDARFEVCMVVPEPLKRFCERLPGMHRKREYPDYPIFTVRGRKL